MKKFAKIISVICILTFALSLSAFAAIDTEKQIECELTADKTSYNVGDTVKVTLSSDDYTGSENFGYILIYADYDAEGLEFIADSTGEGKATDGQIELEYDDTENPYVADWSSVITFTFKALAEGNYTFEFSDIPGLADVDYNGALTESVPSVTITVAADDPETPVSVDTTYTIGEKDYTDVPNVTVTKNLTSAAISGDVVIDYWKDGVKAVTAARKEFSATIGKFTGAGNVSFDVAIMGVPSNVIVTGIDVELD